MITYLTSQTQHPLGDHLHFEELRKSYVSYLSIVYSETKPQTYESVIMQEELIDLEKNDTWEIVRL